MLLAAAALATASLHAYGQAAPPPPFSSTLQVGDTLYVSGTVGTPGADATAEATSVLNAVKAAVTKGGMTMDDLVSVTIFCTDLTMYADFNKVYSTYFHAPYPTRAFIGAKELVRGAHFEIEGIAVKGAATSKKTPAMK